MSIKKHQVFKRETLSEAVESVLSNSSKVMIDIEGGNNMMYLPLDQLINRNQNRSNSDQDMQSSTTNSNQTILDRINDNKNNFNLRKRDLYNE